MLYEVITTLTFSYSQNTATSKENNLFFFNGKVIESRDNFDLNDSIQRIQYLNNLRKEREINTSHRKNFV